ncbi:MAG: helix-turn-helix domain-containing protein [Micrococcales bacterium]|nr:helix-turn-helix domain-containing protein [Micrococcales bacterium]
MNVSDAARALGVSPRRVRALVAAGRVGAHKTSGRWEVTELRNRPARSRPLSARSRQMLAQTLHTRTLGDLAGQDRARTAARIGELRTSPDPGRLLVDWWAGAPPGPGVLAANLVEHARAGNRDYVGETLRRRPVEYLRRPEVLADVVASERTFRRMTVTQLAQAAGVTAADVRHVERAHVVSPPTTRRILRAVRVEPTALPDLAAP